MSKASEHLKPATRERWSAVVRDYDPKAHHERLLTLAAVVWDRAEAARSILDARGLTFDDRFQPRARPEILIERDARTGFARLIRELGLDYTQPQAPRPPRLPRTAGRQQCQDCTGTQRASEPTRAARSPN